MEEAEGAGRERNVGLEVVVNIINRVEKRADLNSIHRQGLAPKKRVGSSWPPGLLGHAHA